MMWNQNRYRVVISGPIEVAVKLWLLPYGTHSAWFTKQTNKLDEYTAIDRMVVARVRPLFRLEHAKGRRPAAASWPILLHGPPWPSWTCRQRVAFVLPRGRGGAGGKLVAHDTPLFGLAVTDPLPHPPLTHADRRLELNWLESRFSGSWLRCISYRKQ